METMMTVTKIVLPALVVGLVAAVALVGCGHRYRGPCAEEPGRVGERVEKGLDRVLDEVEATPDQRTKIRAVVDRVLPDVKALAGDRGAFRRQLEALWLAEMPDTTALDAWVDQETETLRRVGHEIVAAAAEIHDVLTPEQRERVRDLAAKHRRRHW